jgi:urease subunit alpha
MRGSRKFVSRSAQSHAERLGFERTLSAVHGCRTVKKADMVLNHHLPKMEIDA